MLDLEYLAAHCWGVGVLHRLVQVAQSERLDRCALILGVPYQAAYPGDAERLARVGIDE